MLKIEVGDVVKKRGGSDVGPEAWVTVLEKEEPKADNWLTKYTVLQPDGTIATYTDAVLRKMRDVYA